MTDQLVVDDARAGGRHPWARLVLLWAAIAAASAVSMALRMGAPLRAYGSPYDDMLFLRSAHYLEHGRWLGHFDMFTLSKGVAYPAFIATAHRLGLGLLVAEQLTYLLAAAAIAACVLVTTRRAVIACISYVVLGLDPVNYAFLDSQVFRDGWYSSLVLLFLATAFLAVHGAVTRRSWLWVAPASVVCGISGASFWLCREEGLWLVPALAVVVLGPPAMMAVRIRRRFARAHHALAAAPWLRGAGRVLVVITLIGLFLVAPVVGVVKMNHREYGVALTNDLTAGPFARTYADWTRVVAGSPVPNVPITHRQRAAVYAVSPTARQLEPALEDPTQLYRVRTCRLMHLCDDLPGALTVWAIRRAAVHAGEYRQGAQTEAFFAQIDHEILAACADRRLTCTRRLPTALQSLRYFQPRAFAASFWRSTTAVLETRDFSNLGAYERPMRPDVHARYVTELRDAAPSQQVQDERVRRFVRLRWLYMRLVQGFRVLTPILAVLGLAGLAWSLLRPRWPRVALSVLTGGLLVAMVSRLTFVALLDTTQFSAATGRYNLPTHAAFLAVGVVGTAQLLDLIASRREGRRDRAGESQSASMVAEAARV